MTPLILASIASNPLVALGASIAVMVVLIGVFRVHAFFALMLAAGVVAVMASGEQGWAPAIEGMMGEFGGAVGRIGFSIAVAAVIGEALLASGAADRIVRSFLTTLGEKRAPLALLGAGFVLGVPVFFDTVFFLLIPLARALTARTGKNYLLHVLAICAGAVVTHATVPPTPGPLAMAEVLRLELGPVMLAGLAAGILPSVAGLWFGQWCNRRMPIALRTVHGSSVDAGAPAPQVEESALPPFWISIAPVIVPVVLIAATSVAATYRDGLSPSVLQAVGFLGNKNVALLLGALIAVGVYLRRKGLSWRNTQGIMGEPLATAGVIILITAAGGAYGAMIKNAGIGDVIRAWAETHGLNVLVLSWAMAAFLRAAQGSTTVAVITTAGLMMSIGGEQGFGVHPVYLYLVIGYGGLFMSWMNDSGFWLFSRMTGLNERETLKSWTMLLSIISVAGLLQVLVASWLFPGV